MTLDVKGVDQPLHQIHVQMHVYRSLVGYIVAYCLVSRHVLFIAALEYVVTVKNPSSIDIYINQLNLAQVCCSEDL